MLYARHPHGCAGMVSQVAKPPTNEYFIFCRWWPGYSDDFPYGQFNHLREDEIGRELDRWAKGWIKEHPDEWERRDLRLKERADRQESHPKPGVSWFQKTPRGQLIYEVGLVSGMILELPNPGGKTPGRREFFQKVDSPALATFVGADLRNRVEPQLNPRFGFLPANQCSPEGLAAIKTDLFDVRTGRGYQGVLSLLREPFRAYLRGFASLVEEIARNFPVTGEGEPSLEATVAAGDQARTLKARLSGGERLNRAVAVLGNLRAFPDDWIPLSVVPSLGIPRNTVQRHWESSPSRESRKGGSGGVPVQFKRDWLISFVVHRWTPKGKES